MTIKKAKLILGLGALTAVVAFGTKVAFKLKEIKRLTTDADDLPEAEEPSAEADAE